MTLSMSICSLFIVLVLWSTGNSFHRTFLKSTERRSSRKVLLSESNAESESESSQILANFAVNSVMRELGGKIVVSGIEGNNDEDEFMLTLLNEQVGVFFVFYSSFLYSLFFFPYFSVSFSCHTYDMGFNHYSDI